VHVIIKTGAVLHEPNVHEKKCRCVLLFNWYHHLYRRCL